MLEKRAILLTATIDVNLEDILFNLYGIEIKDVMDFNKLIETKHKAPTQDSTMY